MIYRLSVPPAVPDVKEIRVLEWHGGPGTAFATGDLIVELETHKAVVEVRAGQPGILRQINAGPGEWRGIRFSLALFSDTADEAIPDGESISDTFGVEFEIS